MRTGIRPHPAAPSVLGTFCPLAPFRPVEFHGRRVMFPNPDAPTGIHIVVSAIPTKSRLDRGTVRLAVVPACHPPETQDYILSKHIFTRASDLSKSISWQTTSVARKTARRASDPTAPGLQSLRIRPKPEPLGFPKLLTP